MGDLDKDMLIALKYEQESLIKNIKLIESQLNDMSLTLNKMREEFIKFKEQEETKNKFKAWLVNNAWRYILIFVGLFDAWYQIKNK